jgi:hypothetical protein
MIEKMAMVNSSILMVEFTEETSLMIKRMVKEP